MRRLALTATLMLLAAGSALAFGGGQRQPITGGVLGSGQLTYGTAKVTLSQARGGVMEWAKFPPGTTSGWHFHRTLVAVVVTAGTLTLYDSMDPSCQPRRYSAGQGFIEPPNHVHVARNEGTRTVSLYATYIGVPARWRANPTPLDVAVKSPGNCPARIR
jgi:quercetin dioxygenase-like cupin family protein